MIAAGKNGNIVVASGKEEKEKVTLFFPTRIDGISLFLKRYCQKQFITEGAITELKLVTIDGKTFLIYGYYEFPYICILNLDTFKQINIKVSEEKKQYPVNFGVFTKGSFQVVAAQVGNKVKFYKFPSLSGVNDATWEKFKYSTIVAAIKWNNVLRFLGFVFLVGSIYVFELCQKAAFWVTFLSKIRIVLPEVQP